MLDILSGSGPGPYLIIVIYMVSTGLGLPWPEELAIVTVGVLASQEQLDPMLGLVSLLVGGLLGDILMYWVGYHFGMRVIREHPRIAKHLTPEREAAIEKKLMAHGIKVLFVSRFLIGIRGSVYITAGILKYPFRRFLIIDFFCATTVITLFYSLSYYFGDSILPLIQQGEITVTIILALVVAIILAIWWRKRRKHKKRVEEGIDPPDEDSAIARLPSADKDADSRIVAPSESRSEDDSIPDTAQGQE